jgi:hypothetical protein
VQFSIHLKASGVLQIGDRLIRRKMDWISLLKISSKLRPNFQHNLMIM